MWLRGRRSVLGFDIGRLRCGIVDYSLVALRFGYWCFLLRMICWIVNRLGRIRLAPLVLLGILLVRLVS